jgi:hypothetical protein
MTTPNIEPDYPCISSAVCGYKLKLSEKRVKYLEQIIEGVVEKASLGSLRDKEFRNYCVNLTVPDDFSGWWRKTL